MTKVLFVSAELFPLVKTGGLADYSQALPIAVYKQKDVDMRLMLPAYPAVLQAMRNKVAIAQIDTPLKPSQRVKIIEGKIKGTPFPIWAVDAPNLYGRDGNPYVDSMGSDWSDNFERFATLSMMPYLIIKHKLAWTPDIVHANDWHTGLFSAYLNLLDSHERPGSLFTIHNLAFQGNFPRSKFASSGLPHDAFDISGLEFFDKISFLKAGINYSDKVVTVSPRYAEEIANIEDFGWGFCGILQDKKENFKGILNGVDYKIWSPKQDALLQHNYSSHNLDGKKKQKTCFQKAMGLSVHPKSFLMASVSRLSHQKGLDMVYEVLKEILPKYPYLQYACVGTGDAGQERDLADLAEKYPLQVKFFPVYDEKLAHQLIGSSDAFVMPSRFEPCGLTQIYSLKYATLPIVTPVGGLLDTVENYHATSKKVFGDGFIAGDISVPAVKKAILEALTTFSTKKPHWKKLMEHAVKQNFSWEKSAARYIEVYNDIRASKKMQQGAAL